ncbi:MAG TPA: YitT family protein, partial [Candidatus Massiliomicrobiota merdigallinarum]|nr:YitT family protein [Candidatus Massilimicrobiota merdigallinarum]
MKQKVLNLIYIIVGNILIALAVNTLILENHIIVGGTSGIGNVLNYYFHIPVSLSVGCLNVCLFLVGLLFIGKKFAMTTLISTFLFPIVLQFFETHAMFHHYLNDPLLAAILAACCVGVGIGLILRANASTGGVDILAILLNKKLGFPVHIVLNCIDLSILVLQFTFNDTTHVIYGIMIVMITAVVLNKTLTQGTSLVQLTVISDEYETIKESILHEFDAGVTLLAS